MYINSTGYYVPQQRIANEYFTAINGISSDWIFRRTGIMSRSKANESESINYMCIEAVKSAMVKLPYSIEDVDLVIFASYTPSDTIATVAHIVQREFQITNAKAFHLSSACSSAVNAMEIINSFFASGISEKALLVCADRNSSYSDDSDTQCGHLWGDAATAFFFSKEMFSSREIQVIDVISQGLGHIGCGPDGVFLDLQQNKIQMPNGKDVFMQACIHITKNTKNIIERNGYSVSDLSYFIGHQANMRILANVMEQLGLPEEKSLSNIRELGNTGSVSALLVFAQNYQKFKYGDLICLSVFGGGYSAGACLFKIPEA